MLDDRAEFVTWSWPLVWSETASRVVPTSVRSSDSSDMTFGGSARRVVFEIRNVKLAKREVMRETYSNVNTRGPRTGVGTAWVFKDLASCSVRKQMKCEPQLTCILKNLWRWLQQFDPQREIRGPGRERPAFCKKRSLFW